MSETIKPGYTRVSDISGAFAGYAKIPKHALDRAAERGKYVHSLIFDYLNDVLISEDQWNCPLVNQIGSIDTENVKGYFDSFMKFWDNLKDPDIVLQEERYYDDELMITGAPDLVIMTNGHPMILDWKCTLKTGRHWDIQAHGYARLIAHGYVDGQDYKNYHCFTGQFIRLNKYGDAPEVSHYSLDTAYFRRIHDLYFRYFKDLKCNLDME